ncbi:MAG: aminotransferase class I/II-fold pyridoxal phosphate-dependent enzyme, partial [Armatimonadota bacterium]
ERRDVMVDGLNQLPGVSCLSPAGAFYVFPNVTETGIDSKELASRCLEEAGVAVLSGTAFGEYGDGYLRLSSANNLDNINEALDRLEKLLS